MLVISYTILIFSHMSQLKELGATDNNFRGLPSGITLGSAFSNVVSAKLS